MRTLAQRAIILRLHLIITDPANLCGCGEQKSTHHGFLDVPGHGPMIAHIFPQLKMSLLSISQLFDVGLQVTYCADFVTGFDIDNNAVFQGDRDVRTGLWMVDFRTLSGFTNPIPLHSATSAVRLDSVAEFVKFGTPPMVRRLCPLFWQQSTRHSSASLG